MTKLDYAIEQFNNENYQEAYDIFSELSIKGEKAADYYLGVCYQKGFSVCKDQDKAFSYFKKAAKNNDANSQYELGIYYYYVPHSFDDYLTLTEEEIRNVDVKVFEMFYNAAKQGHIKAQNKLAACYLFGTGTEEDVKRGLKMLMDNRDKLDSDDYYLIGIIYKSMKQFEESIKWLKKAYDQEDSTKQLCATLLAETYSDQTDDINAIYWYTKAYENGDRESLYEIGKRYFYGIGVNKDINKAIEYYAKGAEKRDFESMRALGRLYVNGVYVEKAIEKGINYLIEANEMRHGDPFIELFLEALYIKGVDLGSYNLKYETLFKARLNDFDKQIEFGYKYLKPNGAESYKKELVDWLLEDAEKGNKDAQYLIGINSLGLSEKHEWLEKAANQNHKRAQYLVAMEDENHKRYLDFLTSAAEDIIEAQIQLGYAYGHTHIDYLKAYRWYQKAGKHLSQIDDNEIIFIKANSFRHGNIEADNQARLGNKDAQLYLGCLYEYGFEYEFNIKKALYWYELALEHEYDVELKERILRLKTPSYKYKHF